MKKKLGCITIGQSPRDDVVPEMVPYLGDNVEIIQAGALDGLTYEEILNFKFEEDDFILISKLRDGRSVKFTEKQILPRLQKCIDKVEKEGADIILFLCTGTFPDVFKSSKPILFPQKILHGVVPGIVDKGKLAVVIPDKDQVNQSYEQWKESGVEAMVVNASPYGEKEELFRSIEKLKDAEDVDIIVLDCIGYNQEMKNKVSKGTNKPVILSRTMVARVIGEILNP